jgi:hypothetical protein
VSKNARKRCQNKPKILIEREENLNKHFLYSNRRSHFRFTTREYMFYQTIVTRLQKISHIDATLSEKFFVPSWRIRWTLGRRRQPFGTSWRQI